MTYIFCNMLTMPYIWCNMVIPQHQTWWVPWCETSENNTTCYKYCISFSTATVMGKSEHMHANVTRILLCRPSTPDYSFLIENGQPCWLKSHLCASRLSMLRDLSHLWQPPRMMAEVVVSSHQLPVHFNPLGSSPGSRHKLWKGLNLFSQDF